MKGIILAAGNSTRLFPTTKVIPKPLIPVYDKPMIYYSITTLMEIGIKDIMIIVSPKGKKLFESQLGNGKDFGINISYGVQKVPKGVAHAFAIAKNFIKNSEVVLTFGDNIFVGKDMKEKYREALDNLREGYSTIFGYKVKDPERFGVIECDKNNKILSLEEKPEHPKSNIAATGLYFYDKSVINKFNKIKLSPRGEYEITDINNLYLQEDKLKVTTLDGKNNFWIDSGTCNSLLDSSIQIKELEEKNKTLYGVPEKEAYLRGWLNINGVSKSASINHKTEYGKFLQKIVENKK